MREALTMKCNSAMRVGPVEVSPDELLNPILALSVEVLELVHSGELLHVEPVRSDDVCLQ